MNRIPVTFRRVAALLVLLLGVVALAPSATAATARTITMKPSATVTAVRSVVVFSGVLSNSPKRSVVHLQRRSGTGWVKVTATVTTDKAGHYQAYAVMPAVPGAATYRTFAPAANGLAAAASKGVRVSYLRKVTATIKATPTIVPAGQSTRIGGTVKPYVAGTKVIIQKQNGATWTGVTSTTVSSTGSYTKLVPTVYATTYRVSVARTTKNAPATSIGVRVDTTPVIATTALPDGNKDAVYSFKLLSVGNAGGTWTAAPLPAGLSIATNGTISGKPTAAGDTQVTIGFTRTGGDVAPTKTLTLHVNGPVAPVISSAAPAAADLGKPYTTTLTAIGGPTGTWSTSALPAGLSLDAATGVISGTPTAAGLGDTEVTVNFTQTSTGLAATPVVKTLHVNPPTITTSVITKPTVGQIGYSAQINLSAVVPGTWSLQNPPSGYSINNSGKITNGLVLNVPASLTVVFTITGAPEGTPPITRTYTFD